MDIIPGIFEVTSILTIRRGPSIVEYRDAKGNLVTNKAGKLSIGTRRAVLSVTTKPDNSTWGRLSEPDATGVALWACIQNVNRSFMKRIGELPTTTSSLEELIARFHKLEIWAREHGYEG